MCVHVTRFVRVRLRNAHADASLPRNAEQVQLASEAKKRTLSSSASQPAAHFRGPFKYMAPESLLSLRTGTVVFSMKTDVWSYGVVVWEIMTRAYVARIDCAGVSH
jgi:serine/threonine protein kinase